MWARQHLMGDCQCNLGTQPEAAEEGAAARPHRCRQAASGPKTPSALVTAVV